MSLNPGEEIIAIVKRVSENFKYTCEIFNSIKDKSVDIVKEVKNKGESVPGLDRITLYSLFHQDSFVFHLENKNIQRFEGVFEFELENLKVRKEKDRKVIQKINDN